jgi:hypothetical protein
MDACKVHFRASALRAICDLKIRCGANRDWLGFRIDASLKSNNPFWIACNFLHVPLVLNTELNVTFAQDTRDVIRATLVSLLQFALASPIWQEYAFVEISSGAQLVPCCYVNSASDKDEKGFPSRIEQSTSAKRDCEGTSIKPYDARAQNF